MTLGKFGFDAWLCSHRSKNYHSNRPNANPKTALPPHSLSFKTGQLSPRTLCFTHKLFSQLIKDGRRQNVIIVCLKLNKSYNYNVVREKKKEEICTGSILKQTGCVKTFATTLQTRRAFWDWRRPNCEMKCTLTKCGQQVKDVELLHLNCIEGILLRRWGLIFSGKTGSITL